MSDCFLTVLKVHIDDVLKLNTLYIFYTAALWNTILGSNTKQLTFRKTINVCKNTKIYKDFIYCIDKLYITDMSTDIKKKCESDTHVNHEI